jgi:GntR family transcriptional regulator, transcriptional repressor for pyruvate dehydrogenase complex
MAQDSPKGERRQLRQPRLADIVAKSLRERIISGELTDGSSLPTLDRMVEDFGVSPPSVREALRILENEGLISVRRGNVGGAVVHLPKAPSAAHMLGIILQSSKVSVADLEQALTALEPLCVRLCAERADRMEAVVPALQAVHEVAQANVADPEPFGAAMRQFHRLFAQRCGNETLILMVLALETLWGVQRDTWAYRISNTGEAPNLDVRNHGLREHAAIIEAIKEGQSELAQEQVRDHIETPNVYASTDSRVIQMIDLFDSSNERSEAKPADRAEGGA